MKHFDSLASGVVTPALVCFADITNFADLARGKDLAHVYGLVRKMSEIADEVIAPSSGQIIKYIGDAMLVVFPGEDADQGIRVLLDLQRRLVEMFRGKGLSNRVTIGVDVGDVIVGRMAPFEHPDVFGQTVNNAAMVDRRQQKGRFVMTPQAFRSLKPETRKRFHKHTPPVVYLAENK